MDEWLKRLKEVMSVPTVQWLKRAALDTGAESAEELVWREAHTDTVIILQGVRPAIKQNEALAAARGRTAPPLPTDAAEVDAGVLATVTQEGRIQRPTHPIEVLPNIVHPTVADNGRSNSGGAGSGWSNHPKPHPTGRDIGNGQPTAVKGIPHGVRHQLSDPPGDGRADGHCTLVGTAVGADGTPYGNAGVGLGEPDPPPMRR